MASFLSDESGATAAEYGLLAALIAVAVIAAVMTLGQSVSDALEDPTLIDALS